MSDEEVYVAAVETHARALCDALHEATAAGVSNALVLPALVGVFREAGMIPQDLDLGSIMGMLR